MSTAPRLSITKTRHIWPHHRFPAHQSKICGPQSGSALRIGPPRRVGSLERAAALVLQESEQARREVFARAYENDVGPERLGSRKHTKSKPSSQYPDLNRGSNMGVACLRTWQNGRRRSSGRRLSQAPVRRKKSQYGSAEETPSTVTGSYPYPRRSKSVSQRFSKETSAVVAHPAQSVSRIPCQSRPWRDRVYLEASRTPPSVVAL